MESSRAACAMNPDPHAPAVPRPLSEEELIHWLAMRLVPGLGPRTSKILIERFRTPISVFRASRSELEGHGLSGTVAQTIASGVTFDEAAEQQRSLQAAGADIVPCTDPCYPALLREIYDPPLLLFCRGRLELLGGVILGVVGTRRPSHYGIVATERLAKDLAVAGVVVASGMARGIDTAAHKAVLKAGGETIAVFGCGLDHLYPAENRALRDEIAVRGLLISEYPMGAPAHPQNFPVRNRIISGMACGVLIVEGAQYSGSAITAKLAAEQGREVFAVPGNITSRMSWGPNLLIKQGAKLVQDADDILTEFPASDRRRLLERTRNQLGLPGIEAGEQAGEEARVLSLGTSAPVARATLTLLRVDEPAQLDKVLEDLEGFSTSEVIAALFELELLGLVRQLPGKNFVKVIG